MWRGFGLNWNFARAGTCIEEQGMPKYGHHLWLLSPWVKLQPLKYHLEVVKGGWCTSRRHHFPLEGIQTDETPSPFLPSMTIFVSFCYPENLYDWRIFVLVAGPQVVFLCRCLRIRSSDFVVVNAIYVCCIFCYEKFLKTFYKAVRNGYCCYAIYVSFADMLYIGLILWKRKTHMEHKYVVVRRICSIGGWPATWLHIDCWFWFIIGRALNFQTS